MGIISIQDMVNFSPGVSFNMATDRPSIRGIARQSNFFSLDSPVANYFDGVYTVEDGELTLAALRGRVVAVEFWTYG